MNIILCINRCVRVCMHIACMHAYSVYVARVTLIHLNILLDGRYLYTVREIGKITYLEIYCK